MGEVPPITSSSGAASSDAPEAASDPAVGPADPPGTSIGPRPQLGDFGASEEEQRRSLGLPADDGAAEQ